LKRLKERRLYIQYKVACEKFEKHCLMNTHLPSVYMRLILVVTGSVG